MSATGEAREILADVPLVTPEEAAQVCAGVHAEKANWTRRNPDYPFFTLGAAAYLDGPRIGFARYQDEARRLNAVLSARFGFVHDRLRDEVSKLVGREVRYDDRVALPGFHIFLSDLSAPQPVASMHYDMQYEHIDWRGWGTPDRDKQLSLTVTFALPASGGGLLVWNINRLAIEKMGDEQRRQHAAANRHASYHPYTVGHLVAHSGHQLHQIAATKDLQPTDERITMQAHALPVDGQWVIYW